MKLLADENLSPLLVQSLRASGHEVISIQEDHPGWKDKDVLELAAQEDALLLTEDKDFGELVYRQGRPHRGVVLIRLHTLRLHERVQLLSGLFSGRPSWDGAFVVVTPQTVRVHRPLPPGPASPGL